MFYESTMHLLLFLLLTAFNDGFKSRPTPFIDEQNRVSTLQISYYSTKEACSYHQFIHPAQQQTLYNHLLQMNPSLHLLISNFLNNYSTVQHGSSSHLSASDCAEKHTVKSIVLLLLSGKVQPNPGPDLLQTIYSPCNFKNRSGLGIMHFNVRSLLPKMDMLRLRVDETDMDIMVSSETWLKSTITDNMIAIDGYNIFRADRSGKGGGVAIYVKSKFVSSVTLLVSRVKQFDLLALKVNLYKDTYLTVVGCYRPPLQNKQFSLFMMYYSTLMTLK